MTSKEKALEKISSPGFRIEELTPKERELFEGSNEIEDYRRILSSTGSWITPSNSVDEISWDRITTNIGNQGSQTNMSWLSIAATILIVFAISYLIFSKDDRIVISSGLTEISKAELPDGSRVILNSLATIEFDKDWEEREVKLIGKARFDVEKGSTFNVVTGNYITSVLGTSFDVSYKNGLLEVSCYEGKVVVASAEDHLTLDPGQRAFVSAKEWTQTEFDRDQTGRWVSGEFYFDGVPLQEVIDELEKQFALQVRGAEGDQRLYQGYFYKDDLEGALELVFRPMGYDYVLDKDVVTVK